MHCHPGRDGTNERNKKLVCALVLSRIDYCNSILIGLYLPVPYQHYALRQRVDPFQMAARTTALNDNNFIMRMLYKDLNRSVFS